MFILHVLNSRDLQTKNILVNEKGDIVLTYMCNIKEFGDFFCDGINYNLAPEIYTFQEITTATDWWSYGAILYELLVGMVCIFLCYIFIVINYLTTCNLMYKLLFFCN